MVMFALVGIWQTSAQTNNEKAVREVLTREAAAVEKGDLAALDKIWANSEDVTVFESGHANYGWTDYRNSHLAPELKEFKNTKYAFSDLKVKASGSLAYATFKYTLSANIGTRHVDAGGLGTAVLEKRGGRWQIVHWHSSAPRRQTSTQTSFVKDFKGLIEKLRTGGTTVKQGEKISQPFFSVEGQTLNVGGESVQVFQYGNAEIAEKEAKQISPQGTSVGTTMVTWVAPPHFYRNDKLIVLYVGKNSEIIKALENALGRQFAGK